MADTKIEKLVIIGSGPAGLTAAIYAARGSLQPLVISGREAGGQLMLTTDVDDFPGFENGVQGPDLMIKMRAQAERFGTRFVNEDALELDLKQKPFTIKTETQEIKAHSIIIATGASAMWLGIPSEQRLLGKGVSSCAVCDGFFFKGKDMMIIGGGDTAMREAQYLSKLARKLYVVHRRDQLRAQPALQELVKAKDNVEFIWNSVVEEIVGEDLVKSVRLKNVKSGSMVDQPIDAVFVAIGHTPNTKFLNGQVAVDEKGYIEVTNDVNTSVEGVFFAGDVGDKKYKQAVTAAGAGCKAAFEAEEYLQNLKLD